jgi:hypothetical protein
MIQHHHPTAARRQMRSLPEMLDDATEQEQRRGKNNVPGGVEAWRRGGVEAWRRGDAREVC